MGKIVCYIKVGEVRESIECQKLLFSQGYRWEWNDTTNIINSSDIVFTLHDDKTIEEDSLSWYEYRLPDGDEPVYETFTEYKQHVRKQKLKKIGL